MGGYFVAMTAAMRVAVMVPSQPVSPTWLYDEAPNRPVIELYVPDEGDPVLSFQEGMGALDRRGWEYYQRSMRWQIPPLVAGEPLWELLASVQPFATRIAAWLRGVDVGMRDPEWLLSGDAKAANAELLEHLTTATATMPVVELVGSSVVPWAEITKLVGADTTDADLAEIATRLTAPIPVSKPGNVVVVDDLDYRIERARLRARKQVRNRLAIVAGMAAGDHRERDELIRRIAAWHDPADTDRSLGAAAGLSHGAVQKIRKKIDERDDAVARLAPSIESLIRAWAPDPIPALDDTGDDDSALYGEPSDWEWEQEQHAEDSRLRAHRAQRTCAVSGCGKTSIRIVRRWQVDTTVSMPADRDDPDRDNGGYVHGLSTPPRFSGQPTWTVCGTVHARQIIDADRAHPVIKGNVAGNTEFHYEVAGFRYSPDDSELPDVIVELRHALGLLQHSLDEFARDVLVKDAEGAARRLRDLRRAVARGAGRLAEFQTITTPARVYRLGDAEPTGSKVSQVRIGDVIYSSQKVFGFTDRTHAWFGPDDSSGLTWDELLAVAGDQGVITLPREVVVFQHEDNEYEHDSF